jgi:hypothetical protein
LTHSAGATGVERLVAHLFDAAEDDPLAVEVSGWLAGSGGFRRFVERHRDKIRRKLRGAVDDESRRDVRAELRVAHLLLADRRIELAFEAYGSGRVGPDFTVTMRGERAFNLELTRLRRAPGTASFEATLLAKLRQLPPSVPNALLLAASGKGGADELGVADAARALRARADAKDEAFFASRGLAGTQQFYQRFLRLGAVFVWCEGAAADARVALWRNPSARIALPDRAIKVCLAAFRAG